MEKENNSGCETWFYPNLPWNIKDEIMDELRFVRDWNANLLLCYTLSNYSMKIAVTGATGFVGTHLINQLLKSNHEVISQVPVMRIKQKITHGTIK